MALLSRSTPSPRPVRVLQFGEGNFLRAFVDWQIDLLNERTGLDAGVVIVRPIARADMPLLDSQGGVYTTLIRGLNEDGEAVKDYRQITCIQREVDVTAMYQEYLQLAHIPTLRFVISNTTEAGIAINDTDTYDAAPAQAFPAKLTRLLHERFTHFQGATDKGLVLLPCELLDHNGDLLKAAVKHFAARWALGEAFDHWLDNACTFCSTLVDRIVTGYPREEMSDIEQDLGYRDHFLVTAEYFYLFVIEGPQWLADELHLAKADLNIQLVDDITPYKQRKVGVLNGGHTAMVPVALLAGLETVREAVDDLDVGQFLLKALDQEIIPALPLSRDELDSFAADVLRRFRNPFIRHRLESIALNSWSKFAARVMPQLRTCIEEHGRLPVRLVLALAATMHLYRGQQIKLADDAANLEWFTTAWSRVEQGEWSLHTMAVEWLGYTPLWGSDLNGLAGLTEALTDALAQIAQHGMRHTLQSIA